MRTTGLFLGLLTLIVSLTNCSIEKRHFLPGYHVEWSKGNKARKTNDPLITKDNTVKHIKSIENDKTTSTNKENLETNAKDINQIDKNLYASNDVYYLNNTKQTEINNSIYKDNFQNVKSKILRNFVLNKQNHKKLQKAIPVDPDKSNLSTMALVGFIVSTLGLLLLLITGFPFFLGTIGTVFSAIGLSETSKGKTGKGFAIAGLVIGILTILLAWIVILTVGFILSTM